MVYVPFLSSLAATRSNASTVSVQKSAVGDPAVLFARSAIAAVTGLVVQSGLPALDYPSSLTSGIVPKNIHSHNDYTRPVPLLDALSVGAKSVEADLHLIDGKLLIGHHSVSLTTSRTLEELYLDPILEILKLQNTVAPVATTGTKPFANGVFDYDAQQSLQLLLDYKTDGPALHPAVLQALEQFRSLDLLTTFNSTASSLEVRPLTVICSGNCPLASVQAQYPLRDVFLDAPLHDIANASYTSEVSLMASTSFKQMLGWIDAWDVDPGKTEKILALVAVARAKGIRTRFWETPGWPGFVRNDIWKGLLRAGVDWLNADNLQAAANI